MLFFVYCTPREQLDTALWSVKRLETQFPQKGVWDLELWGDVWAARNQTQGFYGQYRPRYEKKGGEG